MATNLMLCGTDRSAGTSAIVLGLVGALAKIVSKVGFLKPIGRTDKYDRDADLIKSAYSLPLDLADIAPVTLAEARDLIARENEQELFDRVTRGYTRVAEGADVVIMEGIDHRRVSSLFELDINAALAEKLRASVLLVAGGELNRPEVRESVVATATLARRSFQQRGCDVLGVIVNKVPEGYMQQARGELAERLKKEGLELYGVVPLLPLLTMPRVRDIADRLDAKVLFGDRYLENLVGKTIIAAMTPSNMLSYLQADRTLIVTPGDRDDTILAAMCSQVSASYPSIAGIVLTGGLQPSPTILRLAMGLSEFRIPILHVQPDTYTTTTRINSLDLRIHPEDTQKINVAVTAVAEHIQSDRLWDALKLPRPKRRRGPQDFLDQLVEQASAYDKHIVFPEGNEERTLRAVARMRQMKLVRATLMGNVDEIRQRAEQLGVDLGDARIVDPGKSEQSEAYAQAFYELRKEKKNITPEAARDQIQTSRTYYATMMVHMGHADGLVSGAVHSTADTIRPALQIIRPNPEFGGLVSSVFFMAMGDHVLVYGDCAIVLDPDADQLASIGLASARTARAFGIEPCVAMLSYATGSSAGGSSVEKVQKATEMIRAGNPDFLIDGPIQYDAAIDPTVAKIKHPDSPLAGKATVFIFPDLDAGNIAYKAVQRSAGAVAIGPILQGLNKPVNDLSRGCVADEIVHVAAVTAIQAEKLSAAVEPAPAPAG